MRDPARLLLPAAALLATVVLTPAGATGEDLAGTTPPVVVTSAGPADELTPELLERLRYGRAVHEEFASGDGCAECHARRPQPLPPRLRRSLDAALSVIPAR